MLLGWNQKKRHLIQWLILSRDSTALIHILSATLDVKLHTVDKQRPSIMSIVFAMVCMCICAIVCHLHSSHVPA